MAETLRNRLLQPCFACGHIHDPESPGACYEAACHPECRETENCPLPYHPDPRQAITQHFTDTDMWT